MKLSIKIIAYTARMKDSVKFAEYILLIIFKSIWRFLREASMTYIYSYLTCNITTTSTESMHPTTYLFIHWKKVHQVFSETFHKYLGYFSFTKK